MVPEWIGCPAANFHVGRRGFRPEAIAVHIMDGSFEAGESVFRDPPHRNQRTMAYRRPVWCINMSTKMTPPFTLASW